VIFNTDELVAYLAQQRVSEILFTPSLAETLLASIDDVSTQLPSLQVVWLNGEVVTTKLLQVSCQMSQCVMVSCYLCARLVVAGAKKCTIS
jgi:phenylacetate-coenzyme A ligase PaaK-like adenylate-forming protein